MRKAAYFRFSAPDPSSFFARWTTRKSQAVWPLCDLPDNPAELPARLADLDCDIGQGSAERLASLIRACSRRLRTWWRRNPEDSANSSSRTLLDFAVPWNWSFGEVIGIDPNVMAAAVVVQDAAVIAKMTFQFAAFHEPPSTSNWLKRAGGRVSCAIPEEPPPRPERWQTLPPKSQLR